MSHSFFAFWLNHKSLQIQKVEPKVGTKKIERAHEE